MAHSHYVMDLYFSAVGNSDKLRREVLRLDAKDDDDAMAEGQRINGWRNAHHFDLRAIQTSGKVGSRLVYSSAALAPTPEDVAIPLPGPTLDIAAQAEETRDI